jgi:hypothetical protein
MATMFAGISTASAQTAGVCVFNGLAGTLTPSIPNALNDPGLIDVEQGSFTYTGNGATCAGVFNGSPQVDQNVAINSAGFYDNLICGTGFAHDLDGASTTVRGSTGLDASGTGYEIPFVGGVGPLLIGGVDNAVATALGSSSVAKAAGMPDHAGVTGADGGHGAAAGPYSGLGVVQITPGAAGASADENCITPAGAGGGDGDTDAFQVKGFFVATDAL